jgi:uncharacterized membrane protein (DUF4010 family)
LSNLDLFSRFGTALAIGFLVGLQREFSSIRESKSPFFAGVRTFPLLAAYGCAAALVAETAGAPVLFGVLFALVGGLIVAAYLTTGRGGDPGATTEVAALLTVVLGALCFWGKLQLAAALGVTTTVLLSAKVPLVRWVSRLTQEDLIAALKFGVVTAVVLPVLPREPLGQAPFDVLVPYKLWLMVVLISALGFVGYVLIKIAGPHRGIGLTGLLGGMVSSTAVTMSFAQKSREVERLAKPLALGVIVAWSVMFARILAVLAVVNRGLLSEIWLPFVAAGAAGGAYTAWLQYSDREGSPSEVAFSNPFELSGAFRFGLLYALVLLVSRAMQLRFGDRGVLISSLLAGVADVDAITLSLADLNHSGELGAVAASRGILLAAISNTAVKSAIVLATGSPGLRRILLPGVLVMVGACLAGLVF